MNKMTEDNYRIGDPKVMTNTKGAKQFKGLHTQKAYTHTDTSSPQICAHAHAYMYFAWE